MRTCVDCYFIGLIMNLGNIFAQYAVLFKVWCGRRVDAVECQWMAFTSSLAIASTLNLCFPLLNRTKIALLLACATADGIISCVLNDRIVYTCVYVCVHLVR